MQPHFTIKNNFQKRSEHYSDILTQEILTDICERITGQAKFTVDFLDETNVGRLVTLRHNGGVSYISLSEDSIYGRNSSFQSLPSAFVRYYQDSAVDKSMFFYFLPAKGSYNSPYFSFMYRLMTTAGIRILNAEKYLENTVRPFASPDDLIIARDSNRSKNRSNNSTYITKNQANTVEVYGKTYGASKKETTLLCVALSNISDTSIDLYQITEQGLTVLPGPDMAVIESLGNINIVLTDMTLERNEFESDNSLRSPRYIYNLLSKLGPKKCSFCDCEIPELIQGAHLWPVADIKKQHALNMEEKLNHATSEDNGIWLCENHHTLFDTNIMLVERSGVVRIQEAIKEKSKNFIESITSEWKIDEEILTSDTIGYIDLRYKAKA